MKAKLRARTLSQHKRQIRVHRLWLWIVIAFHKNVIKRLSVRSEQAVLLVDETDSQNSFITQFAQKYMR